MKIFTFLIAVVCMASCKFSPDGLARDYCDCRVDIDNGKRTEGDCAEMAESHYLKLQDDDEALKKYSAKVIDCMGFTEMEKSK